MKRPNIIYLMSDQMNYEVMAEDGQILMPNLRKLQRDAISCRQAHTVNAICSPARASLMTATLPHRHGMVDVTHAVPPYRAEYNYSLDTFSLALKEEGYHCAYYGKWHVERQHCLEKFGYEEWETEREIPKTNLTPIARTILKGERGYPDRVMGGTYKEGIEASEEYYCYSKAIDFINRHKDGENPFFAFISTYAPHDPYTVPKCIYDMYEGMDIRLPESYWDTCKDKPNIYQRLRTVWENTSEADAKEIKRYYNSYCTLVDTQIGRLMEYLKANDLYDNTLIVVLSDHGDFQGAHGLFCKGVGSFEEGYHIPLVFKLPNSEVTGDYLGHITTCDIAPTTLDIVGARQIKGATDGFSILPAFRGKGEGRKVALAEFFGQRYAVTQRIVWKDHRKYVFNGHDFDEYYDHMKDPHELFNQIDNPQCRKDIEELCTEMQAEIARTEDDTMAEATYVMLRFAPVAPKKIAKATEYEIYNKPF